VLFVDHLLCECQCTEDLGSGKWIKNPAGTFLQGGQEREGSRRFKTEQTWHRSAGQSGGPAWFCAGTGDPSARGFVPDIQFPSSLLLSAHPGHSSSQRDYRSSAEHIQAHSHQQSLVSSNLGTPMLRRIPPAQWQERCTVFLRIQDCLRDPPPPGISKMCLPVSHSRPRQPSPASPRSPGLPVKCSALQTAHPARLVCWERPSKTLGQSLYTVPQATHCSFKGWKSLCQDFLPLWHLSLLSGLPSCLKKGPKLMWRVTFSSPWHHFPTKTGSVLRRKHQALRFRFFSRQPRENLNQRAELQNCYKILTVSGTWNSASLRR